MSDTKYPKVIALTLNWNGGLHTLECLKSLQESTYAHEIIVVDNASADDSVNLIKKHFPEINLVLNDKNLGYSEGYNEGIREAMVQDFDYLLILNNDTRIHKNSIRELVNTAESEQKVGTVTGKVYHYLDSKRFQYVGGRKKNNFGLFSSPRGANEIDNGQYDYKMEVENTDDVFFLVTKEVIEDVGTYSPLFFLYYEETDWCERMKKKGYKLFYTPKAKIWHKGSISTGGGINPRKLYWYTRNGFVFAKRNYSFLLNFFFLFNEFLIKLPRSLLVFIIKSKFGLLKPFILGQLSGLKAFFLVKSLPR